MKFAFHCHRIHLKNLHDTGVSPHCVMKGWYRIGGCTRLSVGGNSVVTDSCRLANVKNPFSEVFREPLSGVEQQNVLQEFHQPTQNLIQHRF